jgi:hypothetical protein
MRAITMLRTAVVFAALALMVGCNEPFSPPPIDDPRPSTSEGPTKKFNPVGGKPGLKP